MADSDTLASPADVLGRVFGYDAFRGPQAEIVEHVVAGGDAVVLMPTGGGKSLCYQIPALVRPGTGVVVSPLIALMQDQVDALIAQGVRAAFLNSTQDCDAARARSRRAFLAGRARPALRRARAAARRLDAAPARARHDRALRDRRGALRLAVGPRLPARLPDALASCTSAGPTCRASRSRRPRPQATRAEIATRLDLDGRARSSSRASTGRTSSTASRRRTSRARQLLELLRTEHPGDAGIVYCLSRASVDRTAEFLAGEGFTALPYHAGLDAAHARAQPGAVPARGRRRSWSRRSRSAWASTSPTCASSRTSTCRSRSRATTRRRAAPAATGCRRPPGSPTASPTSCSSAG